jgi:AraC-like DNA-binding protein
LTYTANGLRRKIPKARLFLAEQDSVTDIAYQLGYSDQSHFIRNFKGFSGTTPNKWANYV